MVGSVVGPSGRQRADANCTVKLPATSFPKDKIKVLLLENINQTAIEIFKADGFQLVSISAAPNLALACQVPLGGCSLVPLKSPWRETLFLPLLLQG